MNQALRPYFTAGVALVGAGMVAVAPAAASVPAIHAAPDVALTAFDLSDINFTTAWTDAIDTAKTNFTTLQTASQDATSALTDALKGADFSHLNFTQLTDAMTFLGGDQKTFINTLVPQTTDPFHGIVLQVLTDPAGTLTGGVPAIPADLLPIVNFMGSPASGELFAALGPALSPMVSLINSFEAISADLGTGGAGSTAALQELVNIPANMFNGMLNGSTLNLDFLAPAIASSGLLPAGMGVDGLSLAFGGLLSPGSVSTGVGGVTDGVGGSIFNAVGIDLTGVPVLGSLALDPHSLGSWGASTMVENFLAQWLSGDLPALTATTPDTADATDAMSSALSAFDLSDLGNAL